MQALIIVDCLTETYLLLFLVKVKIISILAKLAWKSMLACFKLTCWLDVNMDDDGDDEDVQKYTIHFISGISNIQMITKENKMWTEILLQDDEILLNHHILESIPITSAFWQSMLCIVICIVTTDHVIMNSCFCCNHQFQAAVESCL